MNSETITPGYGADVEVLEKHAGELERQLARFRQAESQWRERKTRLREELRQRMKEIDFLYMMLLQRNELSMEGTAAKRAPSPRPDISGN